ncbi:MAG: hypothetical protein ACLSHC_09630 [Bilophila wadsworthia]
MNEVAPEMVRRCCLRGRISSAPGVNPLSLLRASAGMLGGARRWRSTITMQVARLRLGLSTTTLSSRADGPRPSI